MIKDDKGIGCYIDTLTSPLKYIEAHLRFCPKWYIKCSDNLISYVLVAFILLALLAMLPLFILTIIIGSLAK